MFSILDKIIREKQYDKYLNDIWANFKRIDEYKYILSHIIDKRRIEGYKSLDRKYYKRIKKEE